MNTRKILSFAGFGIFLALFACLSSCRNIQKNEKSTVVTSLKSEPPSLHPVCGQGSAGRLILFDYLQKTLTRSDLRTSQQIPILVKGLAEVSTDGLVYTYELRDDVKWDDGSPLTVEDVIFTMKVTKCPKTDDAGVRPVYDEVKDIEKDGANPLKFKMIAKDLNFFNKFTFDELYIIEKKHWDPQGILDKISIPDMDAKTFDDTRYAGLTDWLKGFNDGANGRDLAKLTGLGAYAVTDWKTNSSLILTRKTDIWAKEPSKNKMTWWGEKDTSAYSRAYPEQIIVKIIPDEQARLIAIRNHTLDADFWLTNTSYLKLKEEKDFNETYYSGIRDQFNYNLIYMNTRPDGKDHSRLFEDKNVRRAMAYLTPVDDIMNTMIKGMGTRQASFVQAIFKNYYNDTLKLIPFDIEKAKALLDKAGWIDSDHDNIRDKMIDGKKIPFSFRFTYSKTEKTNEDIAKMIKEAMYKAGVNVELDGVDFKELSSKSASHNFDMVLSALSGGPTPDDPSQLLDTKSWTTNGMNYTGFGNSETDKLIDESNKTIDESKRISIMKKLQAMVYDEQPYIYLYAVKRKMVISKKFENPGMYEIRPGIMFNNLKLKK